MEPETKLEAMTYLVSSTPGHYSLTHSLTYSLPPLTPFPFSISIPISTSFRSKKNQEIPFTHLFNSSSPKPKATNHHT